MLCRARRLWLAVVVGLPAGCASGPDVDRVPPWIAPPRPVTPPEVRPVAHTTDPIPAPAAFAGLAELTPAVVVAEVLSRSPTVAQMVATQQAMAARYPQVTSLDDPMAGVSVAPAAWGSNEVQGGYRLEASQKLPFPGKRGLRGANALAETRAAGGDIEDTRLQLAETAAAAFYDYYAAERALRVNREALQVLTEIRQAAAALYKTGKAPQQDTLQTDVEIGRQRERLVTLERAREVAAARINTLAHLPPNTPLPPPTATPPTVSEVPDPAALRESALARRPDLRALADRVAADQAALELARKEYGPDFELGAAYDTFWQERPMRAQAGLRVNLPIRLARREAAIAEAQARLAQRRAELARRADQVGFEVYEAAAQLRESGRVVRLYEVEILPAAELNLKTARTTYTAGQLPLPYLSAAQRSTVELRDRYYEALAAYGRRRAALERAAGGTIPAAATATTPPTPHPLPKGMTGPGTGHDH